MPVHDDMDEMLQDLSGPRSSKSKPPPRLPSVLVIDDDAAIRRAIDLVFGKTYRLSIHETAAEGVRACDEDVCAVVLDVKMKDQDGFWACDEIRKRHPEVPIIFYSAYQAVKDPYEIINRHRPFAYLTKDGNMKKLEEALETATRLSQAKLRMKRVIDRLRRRPDVE